MNKIGQILHELGELNKQAHNIQASVQDIDTKRLELTQQWQDICTHPEEYVDAEENGDIMCRACGKLITPGDTK